MNLGLTRTSVCLLKSNCPDILPTPCSKPRLRAGVLLATCPGDSVCNSLFAKQRVFTGARLPMLCASQPGIVKDKSNLRSSQAIYSFLPLVPLGQRHLDLYSQPFSLKTFSQTAHVLATTPCSNVGAQSFAKQKTFTISIPLMSQVKPPCYVQVRCKMTSLETKHFFSHTLPKQQQQFHYSHSQSLFPRIATKPFISVDRSTLVGSGGKRLSSKQSPWRQVDAQLSERGLCRVSVPTGGNCQFLAVALHTTFSHVQVRQMVVQFLLDNILAFSQTTMMFRNMSVISRS